MATEESRCKICCIYWCFPILHCSNCMMSTEDTRRSQSGTLFNLKGKQGEEKSEENVKSLHQLY